ncbi:MAG: PHP domain-containing protein [Deltaproteobacteria bacterium]
MKFADLHTHTMFSDGTYTPAQLVAEASRLGLSAVAVSDHDSVDGIAAALEAARNTEIEVIPAIEMSTEYQGIEVHVLGYLIDRNSKKLADKLDFLRKNRVARVHYILKKLGSLGIELRAESVFDISGGASPGRMHIARAMVKEGLVSSTSEAFFRYIGDKSPAYVCGFRISPEEAINLIKDIGGIAVLAHPYILNRDELIPQFVEYGLGGIEVYYPEHTKAMVNSYLALAQRYDLIVTGGSDFHGEAKPEVKLGSTKVPYELVQIMKEARP